MSKSSQASEPLPLLQVTCALLAQPGHPHRLLAARRSVNMPEAGLWEFPGGKLEPGESPEICLARELTEELGIEAEVLNALTPVSRIQPKRVLKLLPYRCRLISGIPEAREHDLLIWAGPGKLLTLNWIPADLEILREWLLNFHNG